MKTITTKRLLSSIYGLACLLILSLFASYFPYNVVKYMFSFFVVSVYIVMFPKKILNPKNIVFFMYFIWYVMALLFADRYSPERMGGLLKYANQALLMCFAVYVTAMMTLDLVTGDVERESIDTKKNGYVTQSVEAKVITLGLMLLGLAFYIQKTGGLLFWLTDPNAAFFSRRGSGAFYLLYSLSFLVLIYFGGKGGDETAFNRKKAFYLILLLLNMSFLGSRLLMLQLMLLLFVDQLMYKNIISFQTLCVICAGLLIFVGSMVVRLGSLRFALSYSLEYFDTFENFTKLLRDFAPGFLTTFIMPFLWPLIKMGMVPDREFYDFSIWLTTKYRPEAWYQGQGTDQWNMESDMYLNYHFWWGIPLLVLYFMMIGIIYKRAFVRGNIWQAIYVYEGMAILSHLRGGLFIFWYWYLLPLYIWLVLRYDRHTKIIKQGCVNHMSLLRTCLSEDIRSSGRITEHG